MIVITPAAELRKKAHGWIGRVSNGVNHLFPILQHTKRAAEALRIDVIVHSFVAVIDDVALLGTGPRPTLGGEPNRFKVGFQFPVDALDDASGCHIRLSCL